VIENESSSLSVPDILRKLTIKDAVYWSALAWDEVSSSLANGFKKLYKQMGSVNHQFLKGVL